MEATLLSKQDVSPWSGRAAANCRVAAAAATTAAAAAQRDHTGDLVSGVVVLKVRWKKNPTEIRELISTRCHVSESATRDGQENSSFYFDVI